MNNMARPTKSGMKRTWAAFPAMGTVGLERKNAAFPAMETMGAPHIPIKGGGRMVVFVNIN